MIKVEIYWYGCTQDEYVMLPNLDEIEAFQHAMLDRLCRTVQNSVSLESIDTDKGMLAIWHCPQFGPDVWMIIYIAHEDLKYMIEVIARVAKDPNLNQSSHYMPANVRRFIYPSMDIEAHVELRRRVIEQKSQMEKPLEIRRGLIGNLKNKAQWN